MSVPTDLYTYCLTLSLHDALPISAQRVARDVGALAVGDRVPGAVVVVAAIVQPHRDHAQGAGDQLGRARALVAVPGHPFHRAVQAVGEPVAQVLLVLAQLDARDAAALEARLAGERADPQRERGLVGFVGTGGGLGHGSARLERALHFAAPSRTHGPPRSEEHTSEIQSLMRISYSVF